VPGPAPSFQSFVVEDRQAAGAGYEGLTTALGTEGPLVYATDFIGGRVDVFDGAFRQVHANAFVDPNLPHGFEPFGIQAIGGRIFVTYAARASGSKDQVDGAGLGFVDMFGREGRFLHRVTSRHALNAPWGLTEAPSTFGRFSGDLLIGNSGDGRILAFEPRADGRFTQVGALRRADGTVIRIDGLRALEFGNGGAAGATNSLFFTAGPDGGNHGLFGVIATAR